VTNRRRTRHVHLGDRLRAVERIRAGETTVEACARELELQPGVIREWLARYGADRPTSIGEIVRGSERSLLERRVARLRECLATTERELTRLHKQLVAALG
jgi:transposase-like protein